MCIPCYFPIVIMGPACSVMFLTDRSRCLHRDGTPSIQYMLMAQGMTLADDGFFPFMRNGTGPRA